ncbi:DUF4402 domain-containing protein [Christiangramia sediminis]|uniref:DUF4402 domain-containing protein n=1 Tax=Christiangramia sediminis TaxID=2881336 RepID=A0A9X1RVN3_9FLAO|nr:DUF4402 domain-containing protein [Christiangramia sediminis]MCB7480124.1 DUF4402 domain-containing protein [Christiangramia sediminis]
MIIKLKILLIFSILCMISGQGFGQYSASANFTASANIIEPVSIRTTSNMNFANIDAGNGGSVILKPDHTRSTTGDVRLDNTANVSAATFEVNGQNGYAYTINIPTESFRMLNGTDELVLKNFNTGTISVLTSDSQTISLGATLEVAAAQKPGLYTTPYPIEITVSYN